VIGALVSRQGDLKGRVSPSPAPNEIVERDSQRDGPSLVAPKRTRGKLTVMDSPTPATSCCPTRHATAAIRRGHRAQEMPIPHP